MNNAGLPGTGLGGLFYVLLALVMPLAELYRTARGRGSRERWRQAGTQFALACGIVASVAGTASVYLTLVGAPSPFGVRGPTLVLAPSCWPRSCWRCSCSPSVCGRGSPDP